MTDIVFDDVDITDSGFTHPPMDAVEYPCTECGREAGPYSGRGRKPTKCPEHKGTKSVSGSKPKTTGKNAQLAGQAADTLAQYNDLIAFVATISTWSETGDAISNANPTFREKAYAALLTDPELAANIVRTGGISGKAALLIAYAMLATAVVPVGFMEARAKKAARAELEYDA